MDKIIWAIVPACILVAGLHFARARGPEKHGLGAMASAFGLAFGPQCLCKDFFDALTGDLFYAFLFGIVLLPVVLLLRAVFLACARKDNNSQVD